MKREPSALKRLHNMRQPGMSECIACCGSGASSKGGVCAACKGTGAKRTNAQHSAESVEHYTPSPIVEAARAVLGGIDLDPASCELAQGVVDATAWYGPGSPLGEDGLTEPWLGRVFLNPPGGRAQITGCGTSSNAALWWARLASSWQACEVEAAIFVGFTLEILRSAQALDVPQPLDFPLCVPAKRIAFDTVGMLDNPPDEVEHNRLVRTPSTQPTHANVIVWLPPVTPAFRDEARIFDDPDLACPFTDAFTPIGKVRV